MKKKILIVIAVLVMLVVVCMTGCSLVGGNSTDSLANSSSGNTVTTYTDVSKSDLEKALTKYREVAENMAQRAADLEEAVQQSIVAAQTNIGGYATVYVNSVLNLTCKETTKSGVSGCQGTGFIITEDGFVITNNHVVSYEVQEADPDVILGRNIFGQILYGTKTVNYTYSSIVGNFDAASDYPDNSTYNLEMIYRDPAYDLALCRITTAVPVGEKWKPIPFYEGAVNRGNQLLVLGNARGYGYSATAGIVSATGKTFTDTPQLTFIQTDAAINGGNSGGPAINIYGGLVGVVNSKFVSIIKSSYFSSEIEDVEGMGFAIELDKVKTFISAAQTNKSVTVTYKTISATNAA